MADPEHLKLLKQGRVAWNAWRQKEPSIRPDLAHADLRAANLSEADLSGADLSGAKFSDANLMRADLQHANLISASLANANLANSNLGGASLTGAILFNANLTGADLVIARLFNTDLAQANLTGANLINANISWADLAYANLTGANLQQVNLINSRLDRANLTDARLWETQRGGWSIKGVICQRAFWDEEGNEPTEYAEGEFERLLTEKSRIMLRYKGTISPIDLIALPMIVERLQAEHPDSALQIHSVQNDAGGASVTITVEDLKDRGTKAFSAELETIRAKLATTQGRLQNSERLRISFEAQCQGLLRVIPTLATASKVNIGQPTAPTTIDVIMNKDTYNVSGQAGAVGFHAHANDMTFQQILGGIDLPKLAEELGRLRIAMRSSATGTLEEDRAIGAVAQAETAAAKGDGPAVLQYLKSAGTWTLKIAKEIGVEVTAGMIEKILLS